VASRRNADPATLLADARSGNRAAVARLLSLIDGGGEAARAVGRLAHPLGGHAMTIGMTGAPGSGKSTLTSALVAVVRAGGDRVAVLAIDPSSPFSGGAILGDRVRMGDHTLDDGVFIRSMATRGHLGGLTLATPEAIRLLDALGFPWILVETVGVGQVEVDVAGAADTTVVVVNPGWGDSVQANKAGLMEIADIFVINKADRAGVADTRRDLEQMLDLGAPRSGGWRPPILETVAVKAQGAEELWSAIGAHGEHLVASGELERRRAERLRTELVKIGAELLRDRASRLRSAEQLEAVQAEVEARRLDPWTAAEQLLAD
jgi:LAO/AO transport system kinase